LQEGYTGRAIAQGQAVLVNRTYRGEVLVATALDSEGRFQFDRLAEPPKTERLYLAWRREGDSGREPLFARSSPDRYDYHEVKQEVFEAPTDVDFGTVKVWPRDSAVELYGSVCRTGQPVSAVPDKSGVMVLIRYDKGKDFSEFYNSTGVSKAWPQGWNGVVCITESTKKVGRYRIADPQDFVDHYRELDAYDKLWSVQVIRLPDGETFRTSIAASPPKEATVRSYHDRVSGDPMPRLQQWLQGLAR
ncbi:MAG TPA: hypothetical protein VNA04_11285, partial [Thermoanaerobaculia bacterium]|nr:hypothetical protein [Thermoanaerobaculia bacterium]